MELHPHWRVDLFMPEVEGCGLRHSQDMLNTVSPFLAILIDNSDRRARLCMCRHLGPSNDGEAIHVDRGHCHITIPKMEFLLSMDHVGSDARSLLQRLKGCQRDEVGARQDAGLLIALADIRSSHCIKLAQLRFKDNTIR